MARSPVDSGCFTRATCLLAISSIIGGPGRCHVWPFPFLLPIRVCGFPHTAQQQTFLARATPAPDSGALVSVYLHGFSGCPRDGRWGVWPLIAFHASIPPR